MDLPDVLDEQNTLVVAILVAVVATVVVGLLVAVVVPVVGTFVMGTGDQVSSESTGPQASFSMAIDEGEVTFTHSGGETVRAEKLLVEVDGTTKSWAAHGGDGGTVAEGDSVTVAADSETTVRLLYDGEERTVLATSAF